VRSDNLQQPLWVLSLLLWLRAAESGATQSFSPRVSWREPASSSRRRRRCSASPRARCLPRGWRTGADSSPRAVAAYTSCARRAGVPRALAVERGGVDARSPRTSATRCTARFPLAQGFASLANEAPLASALAVGAALVAALRAREGRLSEPAACLFVCGGALVLQHLFLLPCTSPEPDPAAAPVAVAIAWALAELLPGPGSRAPAALGRVALVAAVCAVARSRRRCGATAEARSRASSRAARREPRPAGRAALRRRPAPDRAAAAAAGALPRAPRAAADPCRPLSDRRGRGARPPGRRLLARRRAHARAGSPPAGLPRGELPAPRRGPLGGGRRLRPDGSGAAEFEVRAAGAYWWASAGGAALRIDGRVVASPVQLGEGRHRAEWAGGGPLLLAAAPPERWTASLRAAPPVSPPTLV
jgi:hypothetical protein